MGYYLDAAMGWVAGIANDCWSWFNQLSRPEWLVVLGITTFLGYLCMRGFGARKSY